MGMLIRGRYVITDPDARENGLITNGAVYCSEGKVVETGDWTMLREKYPSATVTGNGNQLLMPGLIDGHSHGWGLSSVQRGLTYDYLETSLIDWADLIDVGATLNASMSAIRHIRSGCTTIHHNQWGEGPDLLTPAESTIAGYNQVGIRFAFSLGGRNENTLAYDDEAFFKTLPSDLQDYLRPMVYHDKAAFVDRYFDTFETLHRKYNGEESRVFFGPSWVQGATPAFLQRVKARADELGKTQIHIHTLQTPHQKAYGLRTYGKSLLAHLDDLGLVDENLTLGHAVFISESDVDLLASHRASVTNHPSCNLAMRNGIAPVYFLHKAGVNVALGIDDKGINDDEDAIMELRMIHRLHRVPGFDLAHTPALDAFDVLKMGTTNAARVCGFDGELGALKPGMKADAILLDLDEMLLDPWASPTLNIAEIFIHRAKGVHVNTAIIGGNVVMEDHHFCTVDVGKVYEEVRSRAESALGDKQTTFVQMLQRVKPYVHEWYQGWEHLDFDPFYVLNSRR
jgi:5-methylthioadenosine/S-adenosylhomocysteine deaminase